MRLRVAEIAAIQGLRMVKVAALLEMEPQTVYYWNQGRTMPRVETLLRLCRALGCTVEEMVDEAFTLG